MGLTVCAMILEVQRVDTVSARVRGEAAGQDHGGRTQDVGAIRGEEAVGVVRLRGLTYIRPAAVPAVAAVVERRLEIPVEDVVGAHQLGRADGGRAAGAARL